MNKDIISLGKDSVIYGVGSVVTRFVGLIILPLFTAYLTPEEYGVLAMLAMLAMVAQPIFSLGLSAAMGPSYFEDNDSVNKSKVVWTVFLINFVSSSILILLAWLFPVMLGQLVRLSAEYSFLVSLSLTGTALTILVTSFTQRVQFEKQVKLYVIITVSTALTAILISIYTVVFLGLGVRGMVYGQVIGNLITFLAFLTAGLKATIPSISLNMTKGLLRLGFPLVPSFAFLFILMHGNKYILEWHAGLDAVGIYSIGFNLGMTVSIITGGIAAAWYPFFMSYMSRQDQVRVIFGRIITYYFFSAGVICTAFFIFSKPVVYLLTTENFHAAHLVVGFVAAACFSQMLFNFFLPGLYYNKEIQYVSLIQGVAVVISLISSYFLIEIYEILGASVGLLFGNLVMVCLIWLWGLLRKSKYPVVNYESKRVLSFMFLTGFTLAFYYSFSPISMALEIIKSFILFLLLIFVTFNLLNREEKAQVFNIFKK